MEDRIKPLPITATGTIELFTVPGDNINDVKIKVSSDIPSNFNPDIREHIANVQFGIFYSFLHNEWDLAETGKIFRAGMNFATNQARRNPPDDKGPKDNKPDPIPPKPEVVRDLEKLLRGGEDG